MAKLTTSTDEDILGEHLPYELWMLRQTYERLGSPSPDKVLSNALIESFCIHARLLLEFFEGKQGNRAKDYTGGSYQAVHLDNLTKAEKSKLNTQIAHMTGQRTVDSSNKIGRSLRAKLITALEDEANEFEKQLTSHYKPIFKRRTNGTM